MSNTLPAPHICLDSQSYNMQFEAFLGSRKQDALRNYTWIPKVEKQYFYAIWGFLSFWNIFCSYFGISRLQNSLLWVPQEPYPKFGSVLAYAKRILVNLPIRKAKIARVLRIHIRIRKANNCLKVPFHCQMPSPWSQERFWEAFPILIGQTKNKLREPLSKKLQLQRSLPQN